MGLIGGMVEESSFCCRCGPERAWTCCILRVLSLVEVVARVVSRTSSRGDDCVAVWRCRVRVFPRSGAYRCCPGVIQNWPCLLFPSFFLLYSLLHSTALLPLDLRGEPMSVALLAKKHVGAFDGYQYSTTRPNSKLGFVSHIFDTSGMLWGAAWDILENLLGMLL